MANQNPLDPQDPKNVPILQKMQGNILKHHGRENAWHIFLGFAGANSASVKDWIDNLKITSAEEQLNDSKRFKELKALEVKDTTGVIATQLEVFTKSMVQFFFFSKTGFEKLGIDFSWTEQAFQQGMKSKNDFLQDPDPEKWDFPKNPSTDIDAMILIASDDYNVLETQLKILRKSFKGLGITEIHVQKGEILRNKDGIGIEHFGYADGVSQPLLLTTDRVKPGKVWNDAASPFEMALVLDKNTTDTKAYGSYFVFRKLEQRVKDFKETEDGLGFGEIAGAYIVGRFEDGTPVTKHKEELHITSESQMDNDFDYSNDAAGSKCPYHAHIRMTNPRDLQHPQSPVRIVRRGIPYDEAGRNGDLEWEPKDKVGLLFMCYQKSIENQFEVIQGHWANNGTITNNNPATKSQLPDRNIAIDGVIGQGHKNPLEQEYPFIWGKEPVVTKCNFKHFVTMKGGEYFFAPSIPFLNNLK